MYSMQFMAIESVSLIIQYYIINYTMHVDCVNFQEKSRKIFSGRKRKNECKKR